MKRTFYIVAGVIVVGGLLAASVVVHRQHINQLATSAQNAQTRLQIVEGVDAKNLQAVQAKLDSANTQFKTDQAALCGFIKQYPPKNVTIPSECTASPL